MHTIIIGQTGEAIGKTEKPEIPAWLRRDRIILVADYNLRLVKPKHAKKKAEPVLAVVGKKQRKPAKRSLVEEKTKA